MTDIDIQSLLARAEAAGIDVDTLPDDITEVALEKLIKKGMKKPKAKAGELLPSLAPSDWSATDPVASQRAAKAVVRWGDYDIARVNSGCPEEIWDQIISDPDFSGMLSEAARISMLPQLAAAASGFIKDSAYGAKIASELFKKQDLDEVDAEFARALRVGGTKAKIRAIDDLIIRLYKSREMLTGATEPPPEKIAAIVKSVTEQAA